MHNALCQVPFDLVSEHSSFGEVPERSDGFVWVAPSVLAAMAEKVKVTNHETGITSPWEPYPEQLCIWNDLYLYRKCFALKVRQMGSSTAHGFFAGVWVAANDASGNFVRVAVVVDTDDKAKERIRVISDQLEQLGIEHKSSGGNRKLTFPVSGSEIIAMTAGGRRAGASMTFHGFVLSELPFWRQCNATYSSLLPALVQDGWVAIESTMGIEDPTAKDIWLKPNDFHKRFFSFESHTAYHVTDPKRIEELLDSEKEEWLRSEDFTSREAMAGWLDFLRNRCGGDPIKCFREYPQTPEQSWRFTEGRWVARTSEVLEHTPETVLLTGGTATVKVFHAPEDGEQYVIGVDTAGGNENDHSAIAVIRQSDNRLAASFVSDTVLIDDLVQVAQWLQDYYTRPHWHPVYGERIRIPVAVIESNGIGQGTVQSASALGMHIFEHSTSKKNAYLGMLHAKRYIEAGILRGPIELAEECDSARMENSRFKGRKDLLMACGFCYFWLEQNPYKPDSGHEDPRRLQMSKLLKRYQSHKYRNPKFIN